MKVPALMSREKFRESVFARDGGGCVFCADAAVDAHHILERRLWPDGGYYLNNGASVCGVHHLQCERTEITVEAVRLACGITKPVLPPHLYSDHSYDKWGNPVLANGQRLKGELYFDESVQKVLKEGGVLGLFTEWVKYPRTHHLPWSEGLHEDDRLIESLTAFEGERVIVTEKMDGENTTLYRNYTHARSVDGRNHPTRAWVKQFWSGISADIPQGWRVCGENLYAKHSVSYENLESYFLGFSIWNERNVCLSWPETTEWFALLGITPVPVIYDGLFDAKSIQKLWIPQRWASCEGYVVRVSAPISYGEFRHKVGKFVRKDHVQTVKHWAQGHAHERNLLKDDT
jgi:hypothetical protein